MNEARGPSAVPLILCIGLIGFPTCRRKLEI
jgi:hypothetical protein